jgi:TonB family protein
VVTVVVVGLVVGVIVYVRDKVRPLQEASSSRREIAAAYGAADSFVPSPSGAISPERMEAFLSVREALKAAQGRLAVALSKLDFERMTRRNQSFGEALRTLSELGDLLAPVGDYVARRNRALLEKQMGLGEYAYIYSIAYHSWLGHLPEEGPAILGRLRLRNGGRHSGDSEAFSPEAIRWQYRRLITRLLRNQLDGLKADPRDWRDTVRQEIGRIEANSERVAWQDNLPPAVEACLKPYRGRLEATYSASTNCFELMTLDESRQIEWNGPGSRAEIERGSATAPAEALPDVASRGAPGTPTASGGVGSSSVSYLVGNGVTAPVATLQPVPAYTESALKARAEGVVTIHGIVRKDGSIGSARVVRRLGFGLDEAALDTVLKNWKFKPGKLNGKFVEVRAVIDIVFRLN